MLNLAEELGNVAKACKVMVVSRDRFYRYQELLETGRIDNVVDKSRRGLIGKTAGEQAVEQAVIAYAIEQPAQGQHSTSNGLRK